MSVSTSRMRDLFEGVCILIPLGFVNCSELDNLNVEVVARHCPLIE
jgi:hypothetical protein